MRLRGGGEEGWRWWCHLYNDEWRFGGLKYSNLNVFTCMYRYQSGGNG